MKIQNLQNSFRLKNKREKFLNLLLELVEMQPRLETPESNPELRLVLHSHTQNVHWDNLQDSFHTLKNKIYYQLCQKKLKKWSNLYISNLPYWDWLLLYDIFTTKQVCTASSSESNDCRVCMYWRVKIRSCEKNKIKFLSYFLSADFQANLTDISWQKVALFSHSKLCTTVLILDGLYEI